MGYIKHHGIAVTSCIDELIKEAHAKAKSVFKELTSEILNSETNGYKSFFIAPDGSKEGWQTSNNSNDARNAFLDWFKDSDNYCDYIEVVFGGDDEHQAIVRSKDTDLDEY